MKPRRRSIPKRHVRLTHNQLAYLHRLVLGPIYESALTSESERRALTQAIAAHNGGYAANSPLPAMECRACACCCCMGGEGSADSPPSPPGPR